MTLPDAIDHFLSKPGAEESTPFGPDVLVYKVAGKMFALAVPDDFPARINLKCDPERALALRDEHEAITPGYHMNKRHWGRPCQCPSAGCAILSRSSVRRIWVTSYSWRLMDGASVEISPIVSRWIHRFSSA